MEQHLNTLFFGDNLEILQNLIPDGVVDLVYLDPPFNSNATYNLLFKTPKGTKSEAQIMAFDDTWAWGEQAAKEYDSLTTSQPNKHVRDLIVAFRSILGTNDMMAYLAMMAGRLIELRRVLKDTGSIYLHCDSVASHYLKLLMDAIFGKENFRNEIVWKRTSAHNDPHKFGRNADRILFYTCSDKFIFNRKFTAYTEEYLGNFYRFAEGNRKYRLSDLTGAGATNGESGLEWRGYNPTDRGRHWALPTKALESLKEPLEIAQMTVPQKLDLLHENGLIAISKTGVPSFKRYLDSMDGTPLQEVWTDINPISPQSKERQGYPTQKPIALLERIISASSNEGDVVLDPFCGCGTAVHAAQKLNRQWIGIDITHLAISLIEKRLRDAFPLIEFETEGTPKDLDSARNLAERDKYQFQWWACSLVNAQPFQDKKKGADGGIDGLIYFQDDATGAKKIVVSVKGGRNVSVAMIRDLGHVVEREKAAIGIFITLEEPTAPMETEAVSTGFYESFGKQYPKVQILTIEGLLSGTQRAEFPDLTAGEMNFKKAQKEKKEKQQTGMF